MTQTQPIELGDIARDTITGFVGVVVAATKWLNGCERLTLQPRELKDGTPIETQAFDVQQLALVASNVAGVKKPRGGPCPDPVRQSNPRRAE